MSRREKIILALMGLAIVYGAYTYLWPSGKETSRSAGQSREALNGYVMGIVAALPQMALTETEKYAIASAINRWPEDPFLRITLSETASAGRAEDTITAEELDLRYTGYIEMGGSRLAILNGREYAAGEELDLPGYVLQQIDPAKVVIGAKGTNQTVAIPLEEMFAPRRSAPSPEKKR